jgi:hypothetical protein
VNVDDFLESVAATDLRLSTVNAVALPGRAPEIMDALFYMPLLALTMMVIARRTPFRTVALGRSVVMLLVEHFVALRQSPHGLETNGRFIPLGVTFGASSASEC